MKSKTLRVFGIDPGLARFGWAVVESRPTGVRLVEAGCLVTRAGRPDAVRLHQLHSRLLTLMKESGSSRVALEKLYFSKNTSTAMSVGQARGVALLAAANCHLPIVEFTPTAVKNTVTGDGRADKLQVSNMVTRLLCMRPRPMNDDLVDAIAVAICGLQTR